MIALEYPQYITCTGNILKTQSYIKISHPYFTQSDVTGCMEETLTHGEIQNFIPSVKKPGQREPHSGQFIHEEVLVTLALVAQRGGSLIPRNIHSLDEALSDLIQLNDPDHGKGLD